MEEQHSTLDSGTIGGEPYDARLRMASSGKRIANMLIDNVACVIIIVLVDVVLLLANVHKLMQEPYATLINLFILFFYYTVSESTTSKTPGKFFTHTHVTTINGSKPKEGQMLIRSLCRFIPFEALSFLGNTARGWHDSLSDTYVVLD